jgi:hypothetical protein
MCFTWVGSVCEITKTFTVDLSYVFRLPFLVCWAVWADWVALAVRAVWVVWAVWAAWAAWAAWASWHAQVTLPFSNAHILLKLCWNANSSFVLNGATTRTITTSA